MGQVEDLQEEALLRQQEVLHDSSLLAGLQEDIGTLLEQASSHEQRISTVQVHVTVNMKSSSTCFSSEP